MDIDNLLRYMAVHVFSVNDDSLSGTMAHNYYLYESGGKLNLIPWDYNLCLGGMGSGNDASSVVNSAIDNAFSGTKFFDMLMENETYHNQYYEYLQQLVEEYINGGGFDAFYERVRSQIDELVESDPTAFYSYEDYQTAADMLYQVVKSRGESIQGQIDGTIPSTEEEQRTSTETLVNTSGLDLSVMGSMNAGGGGRMGGDMPDGMPTGSNDMPDGMPTGSNDMPDGATDTDNMPNGTPDNMPTDMPDNVPAGNFTMPQFGGDNSNAPSSENLSVDDMTQEAAETFAENEQPSVDKTTEETTENSAKSSSPRGDFSGFNMNPTNSSTTNVQKDNLILYGVTLLILLIAMSFACFYKKNKK